MLDLTAQEAQRFWEKVDRSGDCWVWQAMTRAGYGLFRFRGKSWSAHRLSYAVHHGDPTGQKIRHTCDNPPCVNPAHLVAGTDLDNSNDKMVRGRHNFPLTNEQVADIKSRPVTSTICRDLAHEFNVSTSTIKGILTGTQYAWVPGVVDLPPQFTSHKLTPEQVDDIIKRCESGKWGIKTRLAEEYGVTKGLISHITNGRLLYTERISDT